jgi:hypothetical protein
LATLPNPASIHDYLVGRQAPAEAAAAASREMPIPLRVTKRSALTAAGRSSYGNPRIP